MQQTYGRMTAPEGVMQSGQDQGGMQGGSAGPADDAATPAIEDRQRADASEITGKRS
jgi:hypothetical protein